MRSTTLMKDLASNESIMKKNDVMTIPVLKYFAYMAAIVYL